MRKAPLIAVLAMSLTGCALVPNPFARPVFSPTTTPPPTAAAPTPTPTPRPESVRLTTADARKAAASWVAKHNRTIKDRDWWGDFSKVDDLFWDGTRHEAVLDKGHVEDGDKSKLRKPILLTGRQTYYVPREQPATGEWFILQATYRGQDRAHILAFWRPKGQSFKLAAKTPLHYGQRVPAPRLDAEGYVTAASDGAAVGKEYLTFWDYPNNKAGKHGYRLAGDNFSRRAYARISKGAYAGFRSHTQTYGFRTGGGGSFHVFSLLNDPKGIWQVFTVGVSVAPERKGSKELQEIAGDWYA
ncbi:hypothetical protein OHA77_13065 [Streptosporangium sp. NBC_01639]|uniref:hypothetical protein n=1 Tax=Streptosporangium sp. NBC_01639 TaxID=2975948 RepID=UPI00386C3567|nr:hypothetical protein OHA77_13065 [Streptosporangium sp. NBC_01639]